MKKYSLPLGLLLLVVIACGISYGMHRQSEAQLSDAWKEVRDHVRIQLLQDTDVPTAIVKKDFAEDLDIGFVIHEDEKYIFITNGLLNEWDIPFELLQETALTNSDSLVKDTAIDVRKMSSGSYAIIETGDGYDASKMVLPSVKKKLSKLLGSPYIVAVPTRDFLIAWSDGIITADDFAAEVLQAYEQETEYRLTPSLFRFTDDKIETAKNPAIK